MKTPVGKKLLLLALLLTASASAFGYGSGGGTRKCKPPQFSEKSPPQSAVVPPGSPLSFTAANTRQSSIVVTAKGTPVDVTITKKKSGRLFVEGKLPESILAGHARIKINAKSDSGCNKSDGWLLKIGPESAQ